MTTWQSVLEKVLNVAASPLAAEARRWAIIGSAATTLQGAQVTPNDIDLLAEQPKTVGRFAELMTPYTPEHIAASPDHDDWRSSQELPVSEGLDDYGFYWTFARWFVDDVKVEIAHIEGPEGVVTSQPDGGIWEAGPGIWSHIRHVSFRGYQVPVVPLAIQLETCLQRNLTRRANAILAVFRRDGYDEALLKRSLRSEHLMWFEQRFSC